MQDTELYQYILGLSSPWSVSGVQLDVEAQQIDVQVSHPECEWELSCYDHAPPWQWRHLDKQVCQSEPGSM